MQNLLKFVFLKLACFAVFHLYGQCDTLPQIDGDLLLCPESEGVLVTGSFDTYQWYKRDVSGGGDPVPVAGATDSFLTVNYFDDVPAWFSVEVTYDTCSVRSEEVLLDGYVFLPPFVESVGDLAIGSDGETILCNGDTLLFILSMDTNIQWFRNFEPIPGANDKELIVTEGGSYQAEGAPEQCPDFIMNLGLSLEVVKKEVDAVIPEVDYLFGPDTFKILNLEELVFWEWYCYNFPAPDLIFVSNESAISWTDSYDLCYFGPYLARSIDVNGCVAWSEEVSGIINSVEEDKPMWINRIYPNPAADFVEIEYAQIIGVLQYEVYNIKGQLLQSASLSGMNSDRINVSSLNPGTYFILLLNGDERHVFQLVKQ